MSIDLVCGGDSWGIDSEWPSMGSVGRRSLRDAPILGIDFF